MQTTWAGVAGVAEVKAGANPPDRKGGVDGVGRRGARRSQSLMPEGASEVRRAGYTLSLRQGGFRSLVLGKGLDLAAQHDLAAAFGQDIPVTSPSTLPRRNSKTKRPLHKHLALTASDPTAATTKQCVSCGEHPDQCLSVLGIFEACDPHHHPSHKASTTPKRTHSLLRRSRPQAHPPCRPTRSLTSRHKPKSILEESGEGDGDAGTPESEVQTPDSEVCTPDGSISTPVSGAHTPDSNINTPEENIGHENRIKEGKTTLRNLRLLEMRSATLEKDDKGKGGEGRGEAGKRRGGDAIEGTTDPALLKTIRRLSI